MGGGGGGGRSTSMVGVMLRCRREEEVMDCRISGLFSSFLKQVANILNIAYTYFVHSKLCTILGRYCSMEWMNKNKTREKKIPIPRKIIYLNEVAMWDTKPQLSTHRCIEWIYKCNFCYKSCIKRHYTYSLTSTYKNNRTYICIQIFCIH